MQYWFSAMYKKISKYIFVFEIFFIEIMFIAYKWANHVPYNYRPESQLLKMCLIVGTTKFPFYF